jgi:ribosomal protein S15P/S13E
MYAGTENRMHDHESSIESVMINLSKHRDHHKKDCEARWRIYCKPQSMQNIRDYDIN